MLEIMISDNPAAWKLVQEIDSLIDGYFLATREKVREEDKWE